jgi:hypothetical protein
VLAALRTNDFDWPLLLHVVGAMLLVGTLLAAVIVLLADWRRSQRGESSGLTRLGFGILALGVLPSYVLMRAGAEWTYSVADFAEDPDWVGIGYLISDIGLLLIAVMLTLAGISSRRARRGGGGGGGLVGASAVLASILLLAYIVAVWAMTAKPGS